MISVWKDIQQTIPEYRGEIPVIETISDTALRLLNAEYDTDLNIFGEDDE